MLLWGNHLLNLNKAAVADGAHEHPLLGSQRLHGAYDALCTKKREDDMRLRRCLPEQRVLRVYLLLALSPTASQSTSHKRF
jgi:hypothetical protein